MQNVNLNEQFFHISSSTTWSVQNNMTKQNVVYPISNVGGLTDVYEKIMNIIQKTKYKGKHRATKVIFTGF